MITFPIQFAMRHELFVGDRLRTRRVAVGNRNVLAAWNKKHIAHVDPDAVVANRHLAVVENEQRIFYVVEVLDRDRLQNSNVARFDKLDAQRFDNLIIIFHDQKVCIP